LSATAPSGGVLQVLDLDQLLGIVVHPLGHDVPGVGEDIDDFHVVFLADVRRLVQIDDLRVLVVVDRAPAAFGGEASGEDEHHVLSLEPGQVERPALEGREGEGGHGPADRDGLDLGGLAEKERTAESDSQRGGRGPG
jgi:hypothetical protein